MKNALLLILASLCLLAGAQESCGQALQAPPLGAASSYALFTSSGTLTNAGAATTIAGDIGTNLGTATGFTAGMYTGALQIENLATEDAAKGVAGAYTYLDEEVLTGTVHGTSLGSETLTEGVYLLGAASTLTGELVLDGQGNSNALFIIKIDGALSTTALSSVRLSNSASWQNVYWQVTGQTTVGTNAVFRGTIVGNGSISFLPSAMLQGRALTRAGAISLSGNRVTTSPVPLPVQLTSFTADRRGEHALVRWVTATEINNAYFAVQSSTDGYKFATIGKVGGQGNSTSSHAYAWTDTRLNRYSARIIYYRLAQVDADSSRHYSPVCAITTAPMEELQLQAYPSPSLSPCSLRIDTKYAGPATVRLTNALGHLVVEHQHLLAAGSNSFPLDEAKALAPGVYLVQVAQGARHQTIRLVRE
jgi:hypothetical protein